jgi:hypothetical protein
MFQWCARQYAKRIVNINVNIVVAGLMATILTSFALKAGRHLGVFDDNTHKKLIIAATFVIDMVFDVAIAVGLHWLANHWPAGWKRSRKLVDTADGVIDAAPPAVSFVKDATAIQFQRLVLSPVLYATAFVTQWLMLHEGVPAEWTVMPSYMAGVVLTRVIHTPWLLHAERKVWEQWEEAKKRRASNNLPMIPGLMDLTGGGGGRRPIINSAALEATTKIDRSGGAKAGAISSEDVSAGDGAIGQEGQRTK